MVSLRRHLDFALVRHRRHLWRLHKIALADCETLGKALGFFPRLGAARVRFKVIRTTLSI